MRTDSRCVNKDLPMKFEPRINPARSYHISDAADLLKKNVNWIKKHWINTDRIQYASEGNDIYFLGQWIIDCLVMNACLKSEKDEKPE